MTKQVVKINSNTKQAITAKEARDLLVREEEQNQRAFLEAYRKFCQQWGYELIGVPGFTTDGRIGVNLTPRKLQSDGNT